MNLSTQLDFAVATLPTGELTDDNIHGDLFAPMIDFGLSVYGPPPAVPGYHQSVDDQDACHEELRLIPLDAVRRNLIRTFMRIWSTDSIESLDAPNDNDSWLTVLMPLAPDTWSRLHVELIEAELLWLASPTEQFPHQNLMAVLDATP